MGFESRDYSQDESWKDTGSHDTPVTKWIVILTIVLFVMQVLSISPTTQTSALFELLSLKAPAVLSGQVWRLVTFIFCHEPTEIIGLVFSLLILWRFGNELERMYGSRELVLFYLASLMLTLRIARPAREVASAVSPLRDVQEGLAYVWTTPRLLAAMVLAFLVNFCAFPLSGGLLPYVARDIYGMDQSGLGFLAAAFAFGGLVGSITLSTAGRTIPAGRIMICFAFAWYSLLLFYAHASYPVLGIGLLMLAGFTQSLCMVPMAVMLLRSSGDRFRGRVMGVRMLAVYGMPVGLLLAGVLIRQFGFVATATAYCVFGIVASFAIAWHWWAHLWPLEAHANRG